MKVNEVYTRGARTCTMETTVGAAGWEMWEGDCGMLPVLDSAGKVVSVITDRDICMAAVTKDAPASEILVRDVVGPGARTVTPQHDVEQALELMKTHQVRRLPVVSDDGALLGVLSMNDLVRRARESRSASLSYEHVMLALKAIGQARTVAAAN